MISEMDLTAEEMQHIILKDALMLILEWRNHPYDKEPSVEFYDILNHLRNLMKKLHMKNEEELVSQAYAKEILNKKTPTFKDLENRIFQGLNGGGVKLSLI